MSLEVFLDVFIDALLDSLKILPLIFIVYILIEIIESYSVASKKFKSLLGSKYAPLFGGLIGIIPQCGFSVVATKLYQGGYILLGTLIAVYFATSDEALPILISQATGNPELWLRIALLIAIKVAYAIVVGFIINAIIKKGALPKIDETVMEEAGEDGCCHHDVTERRSGLSELIVHPLLHSLKIFAYLFILNVVFGVAIELIGEDKISSFLNANVYLQPVFATIIGLIPNCASSVIITQMFSENILTLGATVAGLTVNSGLGVAVLIKDKKNLKKSLFIIGLSFVLSLALGYLVTVVSMMI